MLKLVDAHRLGKIEVALLAASASENTKSLIFPGNAKFFRNRIAKLGWEDLPIVRMPCIVGLSYWDFCFYVDDANFDQTFDSLWRIIAPNIDSNPESFLPENIELDDKSIQSQRLSKWRNTWCDVMSAYSHIHAGRDIFVTNNTKDFQKNRGQLATMGMKNIRAPKETEELVG